MLDPRIYRAAFLPVIFALVLVGFSLRDQPPGATTTLAPDAFDGEVALTQLDALAAAAPNREPGSPGDRLVAERVREGLEGIGFRVRTRRFGAATVDGTRQVASVYGERTGFSSERVLVVAQRDAVGSGARAQLSGTAALLELARVVGSRTLNRTLVLASISGGPAAARDLAEHLGGPVDAVVVLGDLAGDETVRPLVVPWGDGPRTAPLELRRTVETALSAEAGLAAGRAQPATQFARLAFPLTLGLQGPFVGDGIPAVLLSASGERPPAADQEVSEERLERFGRAVLRTMSALDGARSMPEAEGYVLLERKLLPAWPIRLLGAVLLLPVLIATIDGFARVRRRQEPVGRWLRWVALCALPFVLGVLLVVALKLTGLIGAAPPGPVAADAIPLEGGGLAALAAVVVVIALAWFLLRPYLGRVVGAPRDPSTPGAAAAVMIVLCAAAVVVWIANPWTALLLVPALHLWLLAIAPETRLHPLAALALFLVGLVPPLLIAISYLGQFDVGPLELAWTGLLLVAGGGISLPAALGWAVVLGCAGAVLAIGIRQALGEPPLSGGPGAPPSVRGPRTYAGPGSLGGTESALRR
ncbi:hypothetical protein [Conexibacter arvalis]|uniref:Peptidase M28 domain-containing protein n=1 Tax=Conexibacter arvalis TaxID=912552 RepID=A0A840I895_9ACTN|nr:hypothetical protein [Conexibacter arvalis]MBB4661097.1 hypothetical protein [Conexibacter arvalis]